MPRCDACGDPLDYEGLCPPCEAAPCPLGAHPTDDPFGGPCSVCWARVDLLEIDPQQLVLETWIRRVHIDTIDTHGLT